VIVLRRDLFMNRGQSPGPSIGIFGTTEVVPFPEGLTLN
jgi:hypothetical protein